MIQLLVSKASKESSDDDETQDPLEHQALANLDKLPPDYLCVLNQVVSRKYLIKLTFVFDDNFKIDIVTLFDTGADLSCIKIGLVPKRLHKKTK